MSRSNNRGNANVVIGLILLGLGIIFLVAQVTGVDIEHVTWPFFVIIPGLAFYAGMILGGKKAGGLAVPGTIVTTVGLILFYQNLTNHWESWSYAWSLVIVAVGVGQMINGWYSDSQRLVRDGRRTATTGLVLLLIFGAFFEVVLNISGFWDGSQWWWPVLLILAGLLLLVRSLMSRAASRVQESVPSHGAAFTEHFPIEPSTESSGAKAIDEPAMAVVSTVPQPSSASEASTESPTGDDLAAHPAPDAASVGPVEDQLSVGEATPSPASLVNTTSPYPAEEVLAAVEEKSRDQAQVTAATVLPAISIPVPSEECQIQTDSVETATPKDQDVTS